MGLSEAAVDLIVKLLNRNPQRRLGAGPQDAEEVKQHPFFKGLNWEDAKERKLVPPKPVLKPIPNTEISVDTLTIPGLPAPEGGQLNKWTFVGDEFT